MKRWYVVTTTELVTQYEVEGETEQDAYDNFWEGSYTNEQEIDVRNEEIMEAYEIK